MTIIIPPLSARGVTTRDASSGLQAFPVSSSVFLGIGYAARTNTTKNSAVIAEKKEDFKEHIQPEFIFEYAEDYSDLATMLNISASASYGASGVSGGSASLRVMRATRMIKSKAYVLFRMRIIAKESTIKDANLNDAALKVLESKNAAAFFDKFGSHFIRTLYHGGELACVMEFSSTTSQSADEFRAEIKGAVGAAKGEAAYSSAILSLTTSRRATIKYAQAGGSVNPAPPGGGRNGIITLTPQELIERVIAFPTEVAGSKDIPGSTVPLLADAPVMREALNWDDASGVDLDHPYPKEIELIASSITFLKEKLSEVEGILASTAVIAPSVRQAATAIKPYIEYQINETSRALSEMMSDAAVVKAALIIESFHQFRVRGLLGVPSSAARDNAGPSVDMAEPDQSLLAQNLFGKESLFEIHPWPQISYTTRWGFQGQLDDWGAPFNVGTRVPCAVHGGDVQTTARVLAGKTRDDDGIFAYGSAHPVPISGGQACGYHIVHFAEVRIIQPDRDRLPPLPLLPANSSGPLQATLGIAKELNKNQWTLPFSIEMPCATSCGVYTLTVIESNIDDPVQNRERQISSYWYKANEKILSLTHLIIVDERWHFESFDVQVGSAYCAA